MHFWEIKGLYTIRFGGLYAHLPGCRKNLYVLPEESDIMLSFQGAVRQPCRNIGLKAQGKMAISRNSCHLSYCRADQTIAPVFVLQKKGLCRQGAIAPAAGTLKGQGATEYLVLLAVVLGIGLIAISLLGNAPSTATDIVDIQQDTYWSSSFPISILEADAKYSTPTRTEIYLKVKNNRNYPIRITAVVGGTTVKGRTPQVYVLNTTNISDLYYLGPGETGIFGYRAAGYWPSIPENRRIRIYIGDAANTGYYLYAATKICTRAGKDGGYLEIPNFGFEYITYINNVPITKKQIGSKPLIIKCS